MHDKDWQKKWGLFESTLLGDSKFAGECKILNPEVVRLDYDKDKKVVATFIEPILIRNNALGYRILYQMDKLVCNANTSDLSGHKFFEKIETDNISLKNKWEKNRKDIFNNSFRNFLVALSQNKLEVSDFEVYKMAVAKTMDYGQTTIATALKNGALIATDATKICNYDDDIESFVIRSEFPLLVFVKKRYPLKPFFTDYPYSYSEIVLPKGYAGFTENGLLSKPKGIILKDYWGFEGFANMLPDDYNLDPSVKEIINLTKINKID